MSKGEQKIETNRKTRSDKKRDIKPTISVELKESVKRLAKLSEKTTKAVCADLIKHGLYGNKEILKSLSKYFKRSVQINDVPFKGDLENESVYDVTSVENSRISFRVTQRVHEELYKLSYALDCSVSKVGGLLIYESITDGAFIESYLKGYLNSLDAARKKELKQLIKYIKAEIGEKYSLADLLSYLVEEPIKWNFPK